MEIPQLSHEINDLHATERVRLRRIACFFLAEAPKTLCMNGSFRESCRASYAALFEAIATPVLLHSRFAADWLKKSQKVTTPAHTDAGVSRASSHFNMLGRMSLGSSPNPVSSRVTLPSISSTISPSGPVVKSGARRLPRA